MCEINIQTLLGIFVAPKDFKFYVISADQSQKFGLAMYKDKEPIRVWEHFASTQEQIFLTVQGILELALKYGELGYFSGKTFISEYCTDGLSVYRDEVLNEAKAMFFVGELKSREVLLQPKKPQEVIVYELAKAA